MQTIILIGLCVGIFIIGFVIGYLAKARYDILMENIRNMPIGNIRRGE